MNIAGTAEPGSHPEVQTCGGRTHLKPGIKTPGVRLRDRDSRGHSHGSHPEPWCHPTHTGANPPLGSLAHAPIIFVQMPGNSVELRLHAESPYDFAAEVLFHGLINQVLQKEALILFQ